MDANRSTSLLDPEPLPSPVEANGSAAPPRRIGRPRTLPSGRALLGGVLVAASMVGAVSLSRSAGAPVAVPTVVATVDIVPGEPLGPHNLEIVHLAVPDQMLTATYADSDALGGTVSRSHVAAGEILQRGSVIESSAAQRAAAPAREVSLRVEVERAADGRLESGDQVDVLATYGNGIDATTFVVLSDAPVLTADRVDGGVATSRSIVLTLALVDRADTIALAHAIDNADITIVRTTTADPREAPTGTRPFRPREAVAPHRAPDDEATTLTEGNDDGRENVR
jgi:Flp pilus assembly protein CpaB